MKLELVSFRLPTTFPPEAGARFIAECRVAMSQHEHEEFCRDSAWRHAASSQLRVM